MESIAVLSISAVQAYALWLDPSLVRNPLTHFNPIGRIFRNYVIAGAKISEHPYYAGHLAAANYWRVGSRAIV